MAKNVRVCVCLLGFFRSMFQMDLHLYREKVVILGEDQFVLAVFYAACGSLVLVKKKMSKKV